MCYICGKGYIIPIGYIPSFWPIMIIMKSLNAVKLIKLYNASKFKGLDFIMGQKNLGMEPVV